MSLAPILRNIRQGLGHEIMPTRFESAQIAGLHWVNIVGEDDGHFISEKVYCGFSSYFENALAKAVSEKIEREAYRHGKREGLKACQTERSDGFAAYPRVIYSAEFMARQNALDEAIERFVWASWWDDTEVAYDCESYEISSPHIDGLGATANLILELGNNIDLRRIHVISPKFIFSEEPREVLILIAETGNGVFSGGACGPLHDREQTLLRGAVELLRHSLVSLQRKTSKQPLSFYERRLIYFTTAQGVVDVQRRLAHQGSISIQLPDLEIDEQIPHPSAHSHIVHRCRFKGQPEFVGGRLERLCL